VPGCVEFARLAHAGAGGPADPVLGRQLLDLGCRRGVLAACVDIARIYETGDGVEPDSARAEAFLRHACEAGWSEACPPEADGPAGPPQ
jgi:TPR repeat protein